MNRNRGFLILIIALVASACSKKILTTTFGSPKASLAVEEMEFQNFQGKARMILRDANKERDVKANIRIRKDSVIWMSFNVVGIQGGKALINQDSITIVSTVDKEYYVFEYKELSDRFNMEINFDMIQAAMLGNLLIPRDEGDDVNRESSMYILKQQAGEIRVVNYINAASMKVEKVELSEGNSTNSLILNYSNFQPVANMFFPYNGTINLFYKTPAGLLNTTIIFEYNKAEIDEKEKIPPFNIPKRYVRR